MIKQIRRKWDAEMTDRERFTAQMHYKPFDRCFNMEFGYWIENYTQWRMLADNGIKNERQANEFFGFDRYAQLHGNVWLSPPFPDKIISETNTHYIQSDSDGVLSEVKKSGGSSIPHFLRASVVTPDDWMRVKRERMRIDAPERKVDAAAIAQRYPDDRDFPVLVDCGSMIGKIRDMLTFEGIAYACFDYPEMAEDMVETCCRLVEHWLDQVLPAVNFDGASGWEDICFNGGPIVSGEFIHDVVVPRYKRIRHKLEAYGIDLWYTDCDGDVRTIMSDLMDGGINCLFPFEVNSCAHPSEMFDTYGDELRIMGGVDKMALGAGKDAIEAYLQSLIPCVKRGGYIPFCDHRCPPNVYEEDYLFYLDRKRELFGKIK